jgi:hypothetical protein
MHAAKNIVLEVIANIQVALIHAKDVAEQFPKADR